MSAVVPIFIAYLLGGIPFGLIISRLFGVKDIRSHGSGNIGATNVWRVVGARAAVWVYIGDIGKGIIAVAVARYWANSFGTTFLPTDTFLVVCALAAVLGHLFPLYLRFKGGKGVNTALGGMIMLLPLETLAGFVIFVIVVAASRFISLGSMAGGVGFLGVVAAEKYLMARDMAAIYVYLAGTLAALIIITHRQNIRRIIDGKENRFSLSSKPSKAGSDV
jgi:glycerol-3-phosphate acyltransferase PlsY